LNSSKSKETMGRNNAVAGYWELMGVFWCVSDPCNPFVFWLRGKDLNLRPLGYEFNTRSWMGIVVPSDQQHTSSTSLLVLIVSESLVSNLLALFAALPIEQAADFCDSRQLATSRGGLQG
jgi:hypothetical protein